MSIQDVLLKLKATSTGRFRRTALLIMFVGVVAGPLVLLALGGRIPNAPDQPGLAWSFLAITLLLLMGIGGGFMMMFRRQPHVAKENLTITPKHR
jgi:hypothetical protein